MTAQAAISVAACALHLGLALLVLRTRSPVAAPLALLCLVLFGWQFAALVYELSRAPAWHVLDVTVSPLTAPLALHLIAAFVGRARALRPALCLGYATMIGFSIATAALGPAFVESKLWSALHLLGSIPLVIFALVLLVLHHARTRDEEERTRTRLLAVALFVAALLASTDLVDDLWVDLPGLADLGTLISTGVIAALALRKRLLGKDVAGSTAVYSAGISIVAVLGYLSLFRWVSASAGALVLATAMVTLALSVAARELLRSRRRQRQLASLGRFSSQMAHDLKNPLAAMKGALQFLAEERRRGASLDEHAAFLDLMSEQVERMHRVVDQYQRIGKVEPVKRAACVNDIVKSVVALQPSVETNLAGTLPRCELDRDLVAVAVENLVQNAVEAGGPVIIKTERDGTSVVLSVEDRGAGMDARQREHAFDDFYTTKATGSGLGLPFVKRVVEVHGGHLTLTSEVGQGTVVRMTLPVT